MKCAGHDRAKTSNREHPVDRKERRAVVPPVRGAKGGRIEGFEEFCRLRYPQICWTVHGSGLAGIANVSPEAFPFIGGRAYREAAKLLEEAHFETAASLDLAHSLL